MSEEFPAVQGGGSLILAWQIRNKKVLVVGGGEVILSDGQALNDVLLLTSILGSCRAYSKRAQCRRQSYCRLATFRPES